MYNTPYFLPNIPLSASNIGKTSILSKINLGTILTNASKTLNVINQAIPLYYQAKPVITNLKSLTKITKEFSNKINTNIRKEDNNNTLNNKNTNIIKEEEKTIPNPSFFL